MVTKEQIERLRKGLGSTATSTTQEDVTKLLDEREALLAACRIATHDANSWQTKEAARAAIAKAEAP